MKKLLLLFVIPVLLTACSEKESGNSDLKLWYETPAEIWQEALPLGNGRIGAMVYGGIHQEEIQLNEETFWSGSPYNNVTPISEAELQRIQKMVFDRKYIDVLAEVRDNMMSQTTQGQEYMPAGSLKMVFPDTHPVDEYYRELNISEAVCRVKYKAGGVEFRREYFTSFPDQLLVIKMTASCKGSISFFAAMDSPMNHKVEVDKGSIIMHEKGKDLEGIPGKIEGCVIARIEPRGGKITENGNQIEITDADEVYIYLSIATNFNKYNDISGDAEAKAQEYLSQAAGKSYDNMLKEHKAFYKQYFDRMTLDLGTTAQATKPTDRRIAEFPTTDDPAMVGLFYQYGRYLLICSSQPGGQPANLQGLWNKDTSPAWGSKYTVNINTQMNYWPAENTNLSEMHQPLMDMVRELSVTGRQAADQMYHSRGWMLHHNTDIWRFTGLIDGAWGAFVTSNAWFCQHLWNRYLYSGDKTYLADVYPIMKEASLFFVDFLVEDPNNGWLVTVPSDSPENAPSFGPAKGGCISPAPTMDIQLINDLFANTILAARELGLDADFVADLTKTADRLPPMQIGRFGQLQEWLYDWDDPEDTHRHVSHLWGVFPGNQISPYRTPELFEAARTSLLHRGDPSTGWSMAWKVALWARLRDGDHALKLIKNKIAPAILPDGSEKSGTYMNLFDAHPPYQIDGNFGFTAGVTEMFVQSYDGLIDLLPALPSAWKDGRLTGIRTIGGFVIEDMQWKDNKLASLKILSTLGGNCRLRIAGGSATSDGKDLQAASGENPNAFFATPGVRKPLIHSKVALPETMVPAIPVYDLPTEAGKVYELIIE